jgi:putative transposase
MTQKKCTRGKFNRQDIFEGDKGCVKELLREVLQEVLEPEMTGAVGAEKGERTPGRLGLRTG